MIRLAAALMLSGVPTACGVDGAPVPPQAESPAVSGVPGMGRTGSAGRS